MPKTIPPTLTREQLPAVATIAEIAAYERVDYRAVKKAIAAGEISGVFKRGRRSWRVQVDAYFAGVCRVSDAPSAKGDDDDV